MTQRLDGTVALAAGGTGGTGGAASTVTRLCRTSVHVALVRDGDRER
jgi:hypothetical protein